MMLIVGHGTFIGTRFKDIRAFADIRLDDGRTIELPLCPEPMSLLSGVAGTSCYAVIDIDDDTSTMVSGCVVIHSNPRVVIGTAPCSKSMEG